MNTKLVVVLLAIVAVAVIMFIAVSQPKPAPGPTAATSQTTAAILPAAPRPWDAVKRRTNPNNYYWSRDIYNVITGGKWSHEDGAVVYNAGHLMNTELDLDQATADKLCVNPCTLYYNDPKYNFKAAGACDCITMKAINF